MNKLFLSLILGTIVSFAAPVNASEDPADGTTPDTSAKPLDCKSVKTQIKDLRHKYKSCFKKHGGAGSDADADAPAPDGGSASSPSPTAAKS